MQCADITFSTQALPVSDDVCFNSTGVGSAPFTYNGDTSKAASETCEPAPEATDKKNAASNLKVSVASVGVFGLAMAAMMI